MKTKKIGKLLEETAQKSDGIAKVRGRPIKKGQVLNPGGRPKIPEEVVEMCRAASPRAISELIAVFDDEQARPGDKIRASEAILNRAWGSPRQAIDLSNGDEGPLKLIIEYVSPPK